MGIISSKFTKQSKMKVEYIKDETLGDPFVANVKLDYPGKI